MGISRCEIRFKGLIWGLSLGHIKVRQMRFLIPIFTRHDIAYIVFSGITFEINHLNHKEKIGKISISFLYFFICNKLPKLRF